ARLWTLEGRELAAFRGHDGAVFGAAFSPDGGTALTWGLDGTPRLWRHPPRELGLLRVASGDTGSVEVSPTGLLACDSGDGVVVVRDLDGREKFQLASPNGCRAPRFTWGRITTLGAAGAVNVWSFTGESLSSTAFAGTVSVDYSKSRLAALATSGRVYLW